MTSIERPACDIGVGLVFSPRFNHDHFGVAYDEASLSDPVICENNSAICKRGLSKMYPGLGLGEENPAPLTVASGYGITTVAQLFGCEVLFSESELPYARPLDLSDEQAWALRPIDDFEKTEPIPTIVAKADYLFKKYGKAKIDFGYQGYLATALKLRGEMIFEDFYDNPQLADHLLEVAYRTTENLREYVNNLNRSRYGVESAGLTQVTNCAVALVSPDTYNRFLRKYDLRIAEAYGPNWGIHHCGPNMQLYSYDTLPIGQYYDIGFGSDVKMCVEKYKSSGMMQLIRGRLSPAALLMEDPAYIEDKVRYFIDCGVTACVSVGVDQLTPRENVEAFVKSVWKYGKK